jgi:hypothetical protein
MGASADAEGLLRAVGTDGPPARLLQRHPDALLRTAADAERLDRAVRAVGEAAPASASDLDRPEGLRDDRNPKLFHFRHRVTSQIIFSVRRGGP